MTGDFATELGRVTTFDRCQDDLHPGIGTVCENTANALTVGRALGGIALSSYIDKTPDYQSWPTVGKFITLIATDAEGKMARLGRKLQGKDETLRRPWNAYSDHIADKILVDGVMLAIAKREAENGNSNYAWAVGVAAGVTMTRDVLTTIDRVIADTQHIDTRAQPAGKKKGLLQYGVATFALSPFAKTGWGRKLAGAGFLYTAKHSVTSGWSLHRSFSKQRAAKTYRL